MLLPDEYIIEKDLVPFWACIVRGAHGKGHPSRIVEW